MGGRRHRSLVVVLGVVAVLAVACGDDGSSSRSQTDEPEVAVPESDPALDQA